ncbi:kinase-like protein, partial [Colletotrichum asianum]
EISRNHFNDNKTGFLPRPQLTALLSTEAIEKELRRRDSFLSREPSLRCLRFFSHDSDVQRDEHIRAKALKIAGSIEGSSQPELPDDAIQNSSQTENLTNEKSYLKILAILILIERPGRIKLFMDSGVCDADLPLVKHSIEGRLDLRRASAPDVSLECFQRWSDSNIDRFEQWQWALLAPSFDRPERKDVPHHQFEKATILPFRFLDHEPDRAGGFGTVRKVAIHPNHHEFTNTQTSNCFFAVKTLRNTQSRVDFEREVATLKRLSDDFHPNLISLLGTYEKDNLFHLIFPWAEADLFRFWEREDLGSAFGPRSSSETLRWVAQQCGGLADGLGFIHRRDTSSGFSLLHPQSLPLIQRMNSNEGSDQRMIQKTLRLFGRHGDLQPGNILWFPHCVSPGSGTKGTLKITDFGLAEFSRKEAVHKYRRGFCVKPYTYSPPEAALDTDLLSPSYDVWSLGCIYLEFIAWWLGGWSLVLKFRGSRLEADQTSSDWEGVDFKSDLFFTLMRAEGAEKTEAIVKTSVTEVRTFLK